MLAFGLADVVDSGVLLAPNGAAGGGVGCLGNNRPSDVCFDGACCRVVHVEIERDDGLGHGCTAREGAR